MTLQKEKNYKKRIREIFILITAGLTRIISKLMMEAMPIQVPQDQEIIFRVRTMPPTFQVKKEPFQKSV
ncbi:MAG: hypothetical protein ACXACP_04635 [Candidatus Hodarchaeales archaeon]|jgi:hypothetical protein